MSSARKRMREFDVPDRSFKVKAVPFKDLIEKAKDMSRTETVRALKKGGAFFIDLDGDPDYFKMAEVFRELNIMTEAVRNLKNAEGSDSYSIFIFGHTGSRQDTSIVTRTL